MKTEIVVADFHDPAQARDLITLMDCYAADPIGGASPLTNESRDQLAARLAAIPYAFSVICYIDGTPAGLANCFEGFSTFRCKPLINIHDLVVAPDFRGQGIGRLLLEEVERIAKDQGCCKLTLEVLEGNTVAMALYRKLGFDDYSLSAETGTALFWHKSLDLE